MLGIKKIFRKVANQVKGSVQKAGHRTYAFAGFSLAFMLIFVQTAPNYVSTGIIQMQETAVNAVSKALKKPSVKISSVSATDRAITVKWKLSNAKKSKIQKAQLKVSTKKSMSKSSTKTYTLKKSQAKKLSYSLTVKSGKIKKSTTYYFKIRLKVSGKWTAWSGKKSGKVKAKKDGDDDQDESTNLDNYKCKHTLNTSKGETSQIVKSGDNVFDVHSYTSVVSGIDDMFKVYMMRWDSSLKKGVYASAMQNANPQIDYSKISFSFDNGTSGELLDYLGNDICGYKVYSVPNYKTAVADVYIDPFIQYVNVFTVKEETIPHQTDRTYKVDLLYDGVVIASQTRTKKACINKGIKLYQDYGGKEYFDEYGAGGIDIWQEDKFNYYGCQVGTRLEMMLVRYLTGYKVAAADIVPADASPDQWTPYYDSKTGLTAARYKQHQLYTLYVVHVYDAYYDENSKEWIHLNRTGSCYGEGKVNMPYMDYETPIYLSN